MHRFKNTEWSIHWFFYFIFFFTEMKMSLLLLSTRFNCSLCLMTCLGFPLSISIVELLCLLQILSSPQWMSPNCNTFQSLPKNIGPTVCLPLLFNHYITFELVLMLMSQILSQTSRVCLLEAGMKWADYARSVCPIWSNFFIHYKTQGF